MNELTAVATGTLVISPILSPIVSTSVTYVNINRKCEKTSIGNVEKHQRFL